MSATLRVAANTRGTRKLIDGCAQVRSMHGESITKRSRREYSSEIWSICCLSSRVNVYKLPSCKDGRHHEARPIQIHKRNASSRAHIKARASTRARSTSGAPEHAATLQALIQWFLKVHVFNNDRLHASFVLRWAPIPKAGRARQAEFACACAA